MTREADGTATSDAAGTLLAAEQATTATAQAANASPTPSPTLDLPQIALLVDTPYLQDGGAVPSKALARVGLGNLRKVLMFPDGTRILLGTSAGMYVYEYPSMRLVWRRYPSQYFVNLQLSGDGRRIVADFGLDGGPVLFDAGSGDRIAALDGTWNDAAFSPDSRWVAVEERPNNPGTDTVGWIRLYDAANGALSKSLEAPIRGFYGPIFGRKTWSGDSQSIASCINGHVYIWNIGDGAVVYEGSGSSEDFNNAGCGVFFNQDGSAVAVRNHGHLAVVSLPDGRVVIDKDIVNDDLAWGDGQLYVAARDSLKVLDAATGSEIKTIDDPAQRLRLSPSGDKLLTIGSGAISVYDTADLRFLYTLPLDASLTNWSPSGKWLVVYVQVGERDQAGRLHYQVQMINGDTGQQAYVMPEDTGFVVLTGENEMFASVGSTIYIGDLLGGETPAGSMLNIAVDTLSWSDDGNELRVDGPDGTWYWNEASNQVSQVSQSSSFGGAVVAVSDIPYDLHRVTAEQPGGSLTAQARNDVACGDGPFGGGCGIWGGWLDILETGSDNPLFTLKDDHAGITALAWSPDGKLLAVGHGGAYRDLKAGRIDLVDPVTGAVVQTYEGHLLGITMLLFSPNGQRLASLSADDTVIIWNTTQ